MSPREAGGEAMNFNADEENFSPLEWTLIVFLSVVFGVLMVVGWLGMK